MKKSKLLLIASLVLALTMTLGSTLAYLTDVDSETNTFTMGKVDIELEEVFDQNANLWPGKQTNKDASIKNEGATPAWVWMTVVVPANMKDYVTPVWATDAIAQSVTTAEDAQGNKVYTYLVPTQLASNTTTDKILDAMEMSANVDIRQIDEVDYWVAIVNGVETPIAPYAEKLDVTVYGYAVQVEGFADVQAAYDAYNDQWDTTVWTDVGDLAELQAAVAKGGNIRLTEDIPTSETINILEGKKVVLDLNYKKISATARTNVIVNKGTLTMIGGMIESTYDVFPIYNNDGMLVIDGTQVITQKEIKNGGSGTLIIIGGTFGFDPTAYVDPTNYTITQNTDGTWTVTAK